MNYLLQTVKTALLIANACEGWILEESIAVQFSDNEYDHLKILGLMVNENMDLLILHTIDGYGYDSEVWTRLEDMQEDTGKIVEVLYNEVVVKGIKQKKAA